MARLHFNPAGTTSRRAGRTPTTRRRERHDYYRSGSCQNHNVLSRERYYPTVTTLEDGRVLLTAGDYWIDCDNDSTIDASEFLQQERWAIYDPAQPDGEKWQVDGAGTFTIPWTPAAGESTVPDYPRMKMLPYGSSGRGTTAPPTRPPRCGRACGRRWRRGSDRPWRRRPKVRNRSLANRG
jgi:hypothetical protein